MKAFAILFLGIIFQLSLAAISSTRADSPFLENDVQHIKSTKPLKILTIGDSNGALPDGWVAQLKKIRPNDTIYNISISGNTIGFNNLGRSSLNTFNNINSYIEKAYKSIGNIDEIIIMLGTNDCKAVFKDSMEFVPENMRKVIQSIRIVTRKHREVPPLYIVSAPPFGPDEMLEEKYKGGPERVKWLNEKLSVVAKSEKTVFINSYQILLPVFRNLTSDGVHLNADGQKMLALIIQENLKFFNKK